MNIKRASANLNPQKIQIFCEVKTILIGTSTHHPVENPTFKKLPLIDMRKRGIPKADVTMENQLNKVLEIF